MFVEVTAQVLLGAGAFLDATLRGREQLVPLARLGVGLPDLDAESTKVDARDLGGIDLVIGQIYCPSS